MRITIFDWQQTLILERFLLTEKLRGKGAISNTTDRAFLHQ
jgi:hypothetical protein